MFGPGGFRVRSTEKIAARKYLLNATESMLVVGMAVALIALGAILGALVGAGIGFVTRSVYLVVTLAALGATVGGFIGAGERMQLRAPPELAPIALAVLGGAVGVAIGITLHSLGNNISLGALFGGFAGTEMV